MKRYANFFIAVLLGLLIISHSACSDDHDVSNPDSGKIKTDNSVFVLKKSIPSIGGKLEVTGTQSPIEGLIIDIPDGAFAESQEISISYSNITSHELGQYFNPVSPLIEITNGGDYADRFIKLRIPIRSESGFYRMACYYDKKTGNIEPITVLNTSDSYIECVVRHFSLIVVTETQKDLIIQGGGYVSFFEPTTNGWSFNNYGTFPEPMGICAGMSIGAAHYFKNFNATINLFSYFENNQLWFRTSDLWEDDSKGLRFATAIHQIHGLFWNNNNISINQILTAPEEDRFWNLVYSMLIVNQPQLIYLSSSKSDTAHMMIGYAYSINSNSASISIYDPNFSGQTRFIEYNLSTKSFKPYISAANADAAAQGYFNYYDKIAFVPLSSVISDDEMNFLWQKVLNNTVGDGIFPPYKVYAVPQNPGFQKVELNTGDPSKINYIPFDTFDFVVEGIDPSFNLRVEAMSFFPGFGLERYNPAQTIYMENKDTLIGLYLKAPSANDTTKKWLGFNWFKIQLSDVWIEPSDTIIGVNSEIEFIARHNGTAPKHTRFEWDFGDSKSETSTDSFITHKYEEPGDYEVTLRVIDLDNQKEVAKALSKITVTIWPRIAVTIKGMNTTPPSTIKASDGSDIPSISWANKYIATAPAISWNKNSFEVDFQYSLFPGTYTCTIYGTMSDDGKKITFLSAIYTGIAYGGDWTYQAAIVLQNFPIEEILSGQIIGKTLTGKEAESKVTQLSWKQTIKDNQGIPSEITLKSVDWNSNQTELSVFFYDH